MGLAKVFVGGSGGGVFARGVDWGEGAKSGAGSGGKLSDYPRFLRIFRVGLDPFRNAITRMSPPQVGNSRSNYSPTPGHEFGPGKPRGPGRVDCRARPGLTQLATLYRASK